MLSHQDLPVENGLLAELEKTAFLVLGGPDLQVLALRLVEGVQVPLLNAHDLDCHEVVQDLVEGLRRCCHVLSTSLVRHASHNAHMWLRQLCHGLLLLRLEYNLGHHYDVIVVNSAFNIGDSGNVT